MAVNRVKIHTKQILVKNCSVSPISQVSYKNKIRRLIQLESDFIFSVKSFRIQRARCDQTPRFWGTFSKSTAILSWVGFIQNKLMNVMRSDKPYLEDIFSTLQQNVSD